MPQETTPSVSIVVPSYNRWGLLERAIASVHRQIFADWELIVVDDGSTDGTAAGIEEMSRADPRIRLVENRGTHGPAAARNTGLAQCRADWVAFLDSDDSWEPGKLARFMAEVQAHPEGVLIGSDYWMIDRATGRRETMLQFIAGTMIPWWQNDPLVSGLGPWQAIKDDPLVLATREAMRATTFAEFLWVHTSSAMVRREAARALGGFDETLIQTEDIDLWLKLADCGPVRLIAEPLASYEITGRDVGVGERYANQTDQRRPNLYTTHLAHLDLQMRLARRYGLTSAQYRFFLTRVAHAHRKCADAARHNKPLSVSLAHRLAGSQLAPFARLVAWLPALRGRIPRPELQTAGEGRR